MSLVRYTPTRTLGKNPPRRHLRTLGEPNRLREEDETLGCVCIWPPKQQYVWQPDLLNVREAVRGV
jgi:hypothetical protein